MNGEVQRNAASRNEAQNEMRALLPPVDVIEDGTGITLFADLPGVPKEQLNIQVDGETLTIEGAMDLGPLSSMEVAHAEVAVPRFRRVFTLSKELNTEKLEAELKNGVLKLRIQKVEQAQPRRISVQAG